MADNLVAQIANEFVSGKTDEFVDVITFVQAPWGLNIKLTPTQRFIFKAMYGMELNGQVKDIVVHDVVNEHVLYTFDEVEFLHWLYEEGRCNTNVTEGKCFHELVWAAGRRSGKSMMAACVSNYELYKLVKRSDPAKFFGHQPNSEITILNVAPSDDQASVVFDMIQSMAMQCPYMRDRSLHQTMTYFDLQTDSDMALFGKPKASLVSRAGGCASNSLRGRNAIIVIMDEFAHFIDNNGRFSGKQVYDALTPSVGSFGKYGKIITISSPYAKYGAFYDRHNQSFEETETTLMFKMYSAMVNSERLEPELLKAARRRDRVSFTCEYGGEFSERITAWVDDEDEFKKCVMRTSAPSRGVHDVGYYMGIDLGFRVDGTAISIVHKEDGKIIHDHSTVWYSASSDVWEVDNSIYHVCAKYAKLELLKLSDIIEEVKELARWFPIKAGIFDQSNGYALAELLVAAGFGQFEMVHFTDALNHQVYQLTKTLYAEQLLDLYDDPVLVPEMLSLEAERKSKSCIIVQAPNRRGAHDDVSDSMVRAVWICHQKASARPPNVATGAGGRIGATATVKRVPGAEIPKSENHLTHMMRKKKMHGDHARGLYKMKRRRPGAVVVR